jgi:NADPH:quinone reductase-like Zn-dependent oxidoreductase
VDRLPRSPGFAVSNQKRESERIHVAEIARLQPYQTVLITAAGSTTGLAAIALAKKVGARVVATTRTGKKREGLLAHGAHHIIATEEEDLAARVLEITGGEGADVVYDCVAGTMNEKIVQATKIRGTWIVCGLMDVSPSPFPWLAMFIRSVRFSTYKVFDFTGNRHLGLAADEEAFTRARHFIAGGLTDGSLPITLDREFEGLEALPEAVTYMAANQATGKIVVTI